MTGKDFLHSISEIDDRLILESEKAFYRKKRFSAKRWIAAAACICICGVISISALAAAGNGFGYELLYAVAPEAAQRLKPVNISCIDNGIEMTVTAAEVNGEKTTVLVAMRDTVSYRLDETCDLFDSYSIHTPYDQSGSCSLLAYDENTKTATFLLTIEQMHNELIPGDKITFSVNRLLSGKSHSNFRIEQIHMDCLPLASEFADHPDIRGGDDGDASLLLLPKESNCIILEDGVALTGYGIADGRLHIQLRFDDIVNTDNHGFLYLKNQDGSILYSEENVPFWDGNHENSYEEYIFSIPNNAAGKYEVWGEFWTCVSGPIEGSWQVTFPLG